MEIVVAGRHTEVLPKYRAHVEQKLAKVEQLAPRAQRIDVVVSHETNPRQAGSSERVELTVVDRGPVIRAEACADDRYAALDLALGKLVPQDDKPFTVPEGERIDDHLPHHGPKRYRGTDAEAERTRRGREEHRLPGEPPRRNNEVLAEIGEAVRQAKLPFRGAILLETVRAGADNITKLGCGPPLCLRGTETFSLQLSRAGREVKGDLFVHLGRQHGAGAPRKAEPHVPALRASSTWKSACASARHSAVSSRSWRRPAEVSL